MRSNRVRLMVEIALTVALSAVLSMLAARLPINVAGGTISLSMVPIMVLAVRRGLGPGVVAGVVFGAIHYTIEPVFVAPVQVLLDYPVAFGAVGLAGLGSGLYRRAYASSASRAVALTVPFILLGGAARFAAAWLSGIVFFGSYAPAGQPVWLYSAIYNLSYLVPSTILCAIVASAVLPALELALPSAMRPSGSSA